MSIAPELAEFMNDLAGSAMAADTDDDSSLAACATGLAALQGALGDGASSAIRERIDRLRERIELIRGQTCQDPQSELDCFHGEIAELQDELTRANGNEHGNATTDAQFVLPEWVAESVFLDFISGHEIVIEEIESDMLALEKGQPNVLSSLRGKIHSLKGETGVLGLDEIEKVCHALEDYLETDEWSVDLLLSVKDWIAEALHAYARFALPESGNDAILAELRSSAGSETVTGVAQAELDSPPAELDSPPMVSQLRKWDEETLEIVRDFLRETEEGVTQVDEILLGADQGDVAGEQLDAVFRLFHTIKGVAGFLELEEITQLAHTTEYVLDHARNGDIQIEGAVLDLIFDATEMMRSMIKALGLAATHGFQPDSEAGLADLIRRLEGAIEGQVPREEELPAAQAGDRLGDIVTRPPSSIAPSVVAESLDGQEKSGRRLGEELADRGAAKPKQISQALRAQGRADAKDSRNVKVREVVKIDLERVDTLVSLIGELVIVEAMIVNAPELSGQVSPKLRKQINQMSKITKDLQDIGTHMRMVPVRAVFGKMARMVRDLSHKCGKAIGADLVGDATEMDRGMVEAIADPLLHMIRNAVDHGIEDKEERRRAGKPARGTISLRAFHQGGSVVIEVEDDGRGLDRDAILAKAKEKGVIGQDDKLTDQEIYNLIFAAGFSTAAKVTEISGRGVGMDVVRRNIESIRGRVKIESVPGQGSKFTMVLPLTLAIIDGLLITSGSERYIIPTLSVVESLKPDKSMINTVAGKAEIVSLRGEALPLFRLDRLLGIDDAVQDPTDALIVVLESGGKKTGLLVDDVLTQHQVVIKGLGDGLPRTPCLAGAAIMSDGNVGLILDTDEIAGMGNMNTLRPPLDKERPATGDEEDEAIQQVPSEHGGGPDPAVQEMAVTK